MMMEDDVMLRIKCLKIRAAEIKCIFALRRKFYAIAYNLSVLQVNGRAVWRNYDRNFRSLSREGDRHRASFPLSPPQVLICTRDSFENAMMFRAYKYEHINKNFAYKKLTLVLIVANWDLFN